MTRERQSNAKWLTTMVLAALLGVSLGTCTSTLEATADLAGSSTTAIHVPETYSIVSFNIQFLGHFTRKDHQALAELMSGHDLVFVQELVAPPYSGTFPDGSAYRPDPQAEEFFDAMAAQGFEYVLSEEDTGSGETNHVNSAATEWFVAFYDPDRIAFAEHLPTQFLATDRTDNPVFARVPYAFAFTLGSEDMVFVSVHLHPGDGASNRAARSSEFEAIFEWINAQEGDERDYVVLGDMNIENCQELEAVLTPEYESLNRECIGTNTSPNTPKPYDHVLYNVAHTGNDFGNDFYVLDLVETFESEWDSSKGPYPGNPYEARVFPQYYSDHNPIEFTVVSDGYDED